MKKWIMTPILAIVLISLLPLSVLALKPTHTGPAYIPSTQEETRAIPLVLEEEGWHNGEVTSRTYTTLYNPETADMMVELAKASTEMDFTNWISGEWIDTMESYGYEQIYNTYNNVAYRSSEYRLGWRLMGELHSPVWFKAVNALIGIQEVEYNGMTRYAIGIVFRGSSDIADWLADLTAYSDIEGYHEGFSQNAEYFYETLSKEIIFHVGNRYLSLFEIYEEMTKPNSEFCMLVMGHSLGGALTNMLVGRYLYEAGVHPSNLAAYAFATPRTAPASKTNEYPYNNIINIINADDLVPVATVVGHQRFGRDFTYYPDDEFRIKHYGEFAQEHLNQGNKYWQTLGFISVGAKPHLIDASYRDIVRAVSDEIDNSTSDNRSRYTSYSTCGYNDWGSDAVISPYTYGHFEEDLTSWGSLVFRGGVLHTLGDCKINGGFSMQHEDDYLLAEGNFTMGSHERNEVADYLSAGTAEFKGDFTATGSGWSSYYSYYTTGTHYTIFSGDNTQNVYFYEKNQIVNLCLRNPWVNFTSAVPYLRLAEDATIKETEDFVVWSMDLNGYYLEQTGHLGGCNNLVMNGGTLVVGGAIKEVDIEKIDGHLQVGGDFTSKSTLVFDDGQMWVAGNCYLNESLIMRNEDDYLCVDGNLSLWGWDYIPDDHLSAGTVELKGNLTFDDRSVTCTNNAYRETNTHRTILSGDGQQGIYFHKAGNVNRFENLCIRNPHSKLYYVKDVGIGEDSVIHVSDATRLSVHGTMDLKGHTLRITTDSDISEDSTAISIDKLAFTHGGNLEVDGSIRLGISSIGGTIHVQHNLTAEQVAFNSANLKVDGDCTFSKGLIMRNPADSLFVGGTLTINTNSNIPEDHLTAGTVELKGDLKVTGGKDEYSYHATGSHTTIFSGSNTQTITMGAMNNHKVLQACLRNPNVVLSSVHTLRLMEDSIQNDISRWGIYGTVDLNGHYLVTKSGAFARLNGATGEGSIIQIQNTVTQANGTSFSVTCNTPSTISPSINVPIACYDSRGRMLNCNVMHFEPGSQTTQTVSLGNLPTGTKTYLFCLLGNYTPVCEKIPLQ